MSTSEIGKYLLLNIIQGAEVRGLPASVADNARIEIERLYDGIDRLQELCRIAEIELDNTYATMQRGRDDAKLASASARHTALLEALGAFHEQPATTPTQR